MKKPSGLRFTLSFIAILFALTSTVSHAHAEVKAGDLITARNAEQVRALVSRHLHRGLEGHADEYRRAEPRDVAAALSGRD
jgi:hypothetical protein